MGNSFDVRLREYAGLMERHLAAYFEGVGEYRPDPVVAEAMAYSLLGGGKRMRGVLVLAFYRLFREDVTPALPFAAAIEMIHAYSLIHDDLPCMDDDDTRRGKPSCHKAFGEATALLAGDGLLTLAFEAASSGEVPAELGLRVVRLYAESAGMAGMIAGQSMDLAGEGKELTGRELDEINRRKTGALIRAAALAGCILGGATREQERIADIYADHVARAFQIVDDVLDETADPAVLGKPVGSDRENRKNTYAALYGVDRCREIVAELTRSAKERLRETGLDTGFLCDLADMLCGREY